jgi:hypothetical protein
MVLALRAVRCRYRIVLGRYGTCLVWIVLIGAIRYRYGTVQYEAEYSVATRLLFLFASLGKVVVCECDFEC